VEIVELANLMGVKVTEDAAPEAVTV